jgi:hypothetical protein
MSIILDLRKPKAHFIRPELLLHPQIPARLYGVNPRTLRGSEWWDATRREIYGINNFCCWACGRHKSEDYFHQWLEAHEWFSFNTTTCVATIVEVVALCHTCHRYIHQGLAYRDYVAGTLSYEDMRRILLHGLKVLSDANLLLTYTSPTLLYQFLEYKELDTVYSRGMQLKSAREQLAMTIDFLKCDEAWKMLYMGSLHYVNVAGTIVTRAVSEADLAKMTDLEKGAASSTAPDTRGYEYLAEAMHDDPH